MALAVRMRSDGQSGKMPRIKWKPQAERVTTDANGLVIDIELVENPDKTKRRKAGK